MREHLLALLTSIYHASLTVFVFFVLTEIFMPGVAAALVSVWWPLSFVALSGLGVAALRKK